MALVMLVGRHEIEVADGHVLREAEDPEQHGHRNPCGEATETVAEEPEDERGDAGKEDQVAEHERADRDPEEREPEGVQVGRERAVAVGEIAVEGVAFVEPPGEIELVAEIDVDVGPLPKAPGRQPREAGHQQGRPDPVGDRARAPHQRTRMLPGVGEPARNALIGAEVNSMTPSVTTRAGSRQRDRLPLAPMLPMGAFATASSCDRRSFEPISDLAVEVW
jgi:hypothetical protein